MFGLNIVGLKRYNFSNEAILALKKAYQTVIRSHLTIQDAMLKVEKEVPLLPEVSQFLDFIRRSQRGIPRR